MALQALAAAGVDALTRDPTAVCGRQEGDDAGDVVRFADPAERDGSAQDLLRSGSLAPAFMSVAVANPSSLRASRSAAGVWRGLIWWRSTRRWQHST
jgi:hypothetical protein